MKRLASNTRCLPIVALVVIMSLFLVACGSGGGGTTTTTKTSTTAAPAITSANSAVFSVGTDSTFTVLTTGTPVASITESGAPATLTWVDNANGTGTLNGTPTVTGVYPMTFTASNGVGTSAVQTFTLTVAQAGNRILPITNGLTLGTVNSHWVLQDNCQVIGVVTPMDQLKFELTSSDVGFKAVFIDENGANHTSTGTWTQSSYDTFLVTTTNVQNPGQYPTSWTISSLNNITGSTLSSQFSAIVNWYSANSAAFLTSPDIPESTEGCNFVLARGGL